MFFLWVQLKRAVSTRCQTPTSNYSDTGEESLCQNHHVIEVDKILSTDKLSSKEKYLILISNIVNKPTNIYFKKLFENTTLDWSEIYLLLRLVTVDTTLRSFQYRILNNLLFLNKKQHNSWIINTALCSFCNTLEETPINIFWDSIQVKCLWEKLQAKFQNDIILTSLTPQAAILGLTKEAKQHL